MRKFFVISTAVALMVVLFFSYTLKISARNSDHYALATQLYDGSVNIVSAIYLDFRLYDTLFELLIFSVAITGVSFYARRVRKSGEILAERSPLIEFELLVLGFFAALWGIYTTLTGHLQPGGAFSGGAIGASGIVMLTFAVGSKKIHLLSEKLELEKLENTVIFIFLAYVFFANVKGGFFYPGFGTGEIGSFFSGRGALLLNSTIGFKVFVGGWIIFYEFSKRKESI